MKTNQKIRKKHQTREIQPPNTAADVRLPFIEHVYELRKRLIYIAASVLLFSTLAYFVQQSLVNFLLRPSHGQQFIYTSPGGGINFLFTVCAYVGIAASIPVIIYQVLGFFEPLIKDHTRRSVIRYSYVSVGLAAMGFCFGYFMGLPAALHFLSNQFTTRQVHALFTIQEYMSFLTIYLLGSMLLFQLPIILLFINRIKPLSPRKLLGGERYVIVAAFVIAMIMAPTPNVLNQLIIAGPVILTYNISVCLIWAKNRRDGRPAHIIELLEQDRQAQETRLQAPRVVIPVDEPLATTQPPHKPIAIRFVGPGQYTVPVRHA